MTIIYRLLSFFINLFAVILAFSLIILLPTALSNTALLIPVFLLVCVVLYSWFSTRFRHQVLKGHLQAKASLRDLIRVNGLVSLIFCGINIPSTIVLLRNPASLLEMLKEMMKQYPQKMQQEVALSSINTLGIIMLTYFIALFIHVLWTIVLLKKNESFFEK